MAEDPHSSAPEQRQPGERRLERPPSERYLAPAAEGPPIVGSPARALAWGAATAVLGAVAVTVAGGLLTITAGLLVIAGVVGWATALAVASGGGPDLARRTRVAFATTLAVVGIALGQVGLWLLGREEGGVLSLGDYLAETFGILVPIELAIAGLSAWWRSR
jgi:hypothetical protein